jgi:hypothetical protein
MALPQTRTLTDASGFGWLVTVDRGRLVLTRPADGERIVLSDPAELRWLGMQLYRAVIDQEQETQHAAASASARRRQLRKLAGEPTGLRHRPFTDPPEPPIHADLEVPA